MSSNAGAQTAVEGTIEPGNFVKPAARGRHMLGRAA